MYTTLFWWRIQSATSSKFYGPRCTPLTKSSGPNRKETVSIKKLRQGNACWATHKTILGWDFDTVDGTLTLPAHRLDRLYALLDFFPLTRRRVPLLEWHQLLGNLRFMATALPGARGLFSALQDSSRTGDCHRVCLNKLVVDSLADFRGIMDNLRTRPTRFRELVPVGPPVAHGVCDACQCGMGCIWFRPFAPPIVWRAAFPLVLQRALVTSDNHAGITSISDLELASTLAHKHIIVQAHPNIAERPIWLGGENRASIAWATKEGSLTASTACANLLRLGALHQRRHRYVPQHNYVPGKVNAMADDASRWWNLFDAALLTHFDSIYQQDTSWRLQTVQPARLLAVTGALSRKCSVPANLRIAATAPPPLGESGNVSALSPASDPTLPMSRATVSPSCSSLPTDI
jgi:hypothetical protein